MKTKSRKTKGRKTKGRKHSSSSRRKGRGIMRTARHLSEKDEFYGFLANSSCELFKNGTNGLIFKLTIDDIKKSTYVSTNLETYGEKVNTLLIKVIFLKNNSSVGENVKLKISTDVLTINLSTEPECEEEINIQKQIYLLTNDFMEPICPNIVFDEFLTEADTVPFLEKLLVCSTADPDATEIIRDIIMKISNFNICIFTMEFANGYSTLEKNDPYAYKEMAMVLLLELALKTGYTHGDFHRGNIMINKTAKGYFGSIKGKPLLIDFGLSKKIPPHVQNAIEELCYHGQYTQALNRLCTVSRKDGTPITVYPGYYGWACGSVPVVGDVNKEIADKIKEREDASSTLTELLEYKDNLTISGFCDLLFLTFSKNNQKEYNTIRETIVDSGSADDPVEIENKIKDIYLTRERNKTTKEIKSIKESIHISVLYDIAHVRNLRFPQDTNLHIGELLEQRRIMKQLYRERRMASSTAQLSNMQHKKK